MVKCKTGKGNLYLTENWLSWKEIWCAADNHIYMCRICAKGFLDSNINQAVIDKMSNLQEIAPNFTFTLPYRRKWSKNPEKKKEVFRKYIMWNTGGSMVHSYTNHVFDLN